MVSCSVSKRNNKGFTLVEVIVVAVIVAVLALVGIQLYQGYVTQSRQGAANNLAAQATSFLQTAVNSTNVTIVDNLPDALTGMNPTWTVHIGTAANPDSVSFNCPSNALINKVDGSGVVTATIGSITNEGTFRYK